MYLIQSEYIITCNQEFEILKNKAVLFDNKILKIDDFYRLKKYHPESIVIKKEKNSIIMPGLINTHLHLEFSSNKTSLHYGDFIKWLTSVIKNRENVIKNTTSKIMKKELNKILNSGTTSIGAISSYGLDLQSLSESSLKVTYFNEVIGSQKQNTNNIFKNLKQRFNKSQIKKTDIFTPAIAIHSLYSLHPNLLKKVIKFIKKKKLLSSVHFLESKYERKWLQNNSGKFRKFFKYFFKTKTSTMNIEYFLKQISSLSSLIFTHNNYIKKKEFKFLLKNKSKFHITHCPMSNRILGNKKMKFSYIKKLNANIGTDGLSSNTSLSMFDELRSALLIYSNKKIKNLAKQLIMSATKNGARALNINSGEISIGKDSDLILINLPDKCKKKNVLLNTILHTKKVSKSFINGVLAYEQRHTK